jgi:hypothetical protein
MEPNKVKIVLQRYFNGESSHEDEEMLKTYFRSGEVAEELREYTEFFGGLAELAQPHPEGSSIEEEVMKYIRDQENTQKSRKLSLWRTVTGIAASLLIVFSSLLIYEQQKKPFEDTFSDPEKAYVVAEQTLKYISGKYQTGVDQLSKTQKYNEALALLDKMEIVKTAPQPLRKSMNTIRKGFEITDEITK